MRGRAGGKGGCEGETREGKGVREWGGSDEKGRRGGDRRGRKWEKF